MDGLGNEVALRQQVKSCVDKISTNAIALSLMLSDDQVKLDCRKVAERAEEVKPLFAVFPTRDPAVYKDTAHQLDNKTNAIHLGLSTFKFVCKTEEQKSLLKETQDAKDLLLSLLKRYIDASDPAKLVAGESPIAGVDMIRPMRLAQ